MNSAAGQALYQSIVNDDLESVNLQLNHGITNLEERDQASIILHNELVLKEWVIHARFLTLLFLHTAVLNSWMHSNLLIHHSISRSVSLLLARPHSNSLHHSRLPTHTNSYSFNFTRSYSLSLTRLTDSVLSLYSLHQSLLHSPTRGFHSSSHSLAHCHYIHSITHFYTRLFAHSITCSCRHRSVSSLWFAVGSDIF